ncbi:molybdate transport system ATP-binding protein [Pseudooceanicola antarcticus]|uniref:Molybdate transport system ATP-binding protein n=1 Tax=Pseudooceanicola antarcticus TaxID=1247613 RepID=A0A285J433_9RHOB|nr:molybdenum ABC transporter ATP-binding protein [Pseudooceanicola antarcticus]PJE29650.1 molybdenum ABC transporter ATP-binding protein [Pseudooceanicola antarcticus]SNY54962.1 molybdate transport system ATP-binding protein [Pseudooceanicola antarcticus]
MSLSLRLRHSFGSAGLDLSFEAPPGLTVLFGASGAGKTSVVRAVAGLLRPDEGRIALDERVLFDSGQGVDLRPHRRRVGYVFQEPRLFPHLSVRGNLGYGRRFARAGKSQDFDRITDMLGLAPLLSRRPGALSGGEQQRVAIGRALLSDPQILLADEPLSALDTARKDEILPWLERLRDEAGLPILYVSHSVQEVARLATTVIELEAGRITRMGPAVEVFSDPGFTPSGTREAGALITARIRSHHADGLSELDAGGAALFLPRLAQPEGTELRLRLPASDVILSRRRPEGLSALNIVAGRVVSIREGHGPGALVAVETRAGQILARLTQRSVSALELAEGVECHAILKTLSIAPGNVGSG